MCERVENTCASEEILSSDIQASDRPKWENQ